MKHCVEMKEVKGMRKKYIIPEMKVMEFEDVDVITTSIQNGLQLENSGDGGSDSFGDLFG